MKPNKVELREGYTSLTCTHFNSLFIHSNGSFSATDEFYFWRNNFIRPNRSTIINTDFAVRSGDTFSLPNNLQVVFSRRQWKRFRENSKTEVK